MDDDELQVVDYLSDTAGQQLPPRDAAVRNNRRERGHGENPRLRPSPPPPPSLFSLHLVQAVQSNNLETLRVILSKADEYQDSSEEERDNDVDKALKEAASLGHVESCEILLEKLSPSYRAKYTYLDEGRDDIVALSGNNHMHVTPMQKAASGGHLEVVQLLKNKYNHDVNQMSRLQIGDTPLFCALQSRSARRLDVCRFLLAHGANPNRGGPRVEAGAAALTFAVPLPPPPHDGRHAPLPAGFRIADIARARLDRFAPTRSHHLGSSSIDDCGDLLYHAVNLEYTDMVRLLLDHGGNPNFGRVPASYEHSHEFDRLSDVAIKKGNAEILSLLLEHGAFVGKYEPRRRRRQLHFANNDVQVVVNVEATTSLNTLLQMAEKPLAVKNAVARVVVEHSQRQDRGDRDNTVAFLDACLEQEVNAGNADTCELLLQAGTVPTRSCLYAAIQHGKTHICRLLIRHGADPFQQQRSPEACNHEQEVILPPPSPFHAAIRRKQTSILQLLLRRWDRSFAANGGKNEYGQLPIQVLCRYKHVSLPALELVLERAHDAAAVERRDDDEQGGNRGHFPFYTAAQSDTSLDVVYRLVLHYPDALSHTLHNTTSDAEKAEYQKQQQQQLLAAAASASSSKKEMRRKRAKAIRRL